MFVEIKYEGEIIFVNKEQLVGYAGCEVLSEVEELPEDNLFGMVSPEHLASVHAQKAVEAVLILSGYKLTCGILFAESEALDVPIEEIAKQVHLHRQSETEFEAGRRLYKKK